MLRPLRADAVDAVLALRDDTTLCNPSPLELEQHLDHLEGALLAGEPALFATYAVWFKGMLRSHGAPTSGLVHCLDLFGLFFDLKSPAAQARALRAILDAGSAALEADSLSVEPLSPRVPALPAASCYRHSAMSGNKDEALALMHAAMQQGCTLSEASVRLIQPAMIEVGRLWQVNLVTIAREHMATSISQTVLALAYVEADFAPATGRKAMFASVAGNHHSLGLRILSDAFETIGWESVFLGADMPIEGLVQQVDSAPPDLVCLSVAMPGQLGSARATTERLRAEFGGRCPTIWVGGQGTLATERAWRAAKADGWAADALHALEQA